MARTPTYTGVTTISNNKQVLMEEDSQNFDFLVSDRPLEEVFFYPMLSYVSYMEDTNALDVTGTLPPSLSIHSSTPFAKEPLKEFLTKPHSHHLC